MNASDELKYSYSSKPRAVQTNRAKAQRAANDGTPAPYATKPAPPNIMHDPRVVRGSVFAAHLLVSPRGDNNNKEKPKKRRSQGGVSSNNNRKSSLFSSQKAMSHSYTPINLEENLLEQPRQVTEREVFSQTDEFKRYVLPKKAIATADGKFQRPKVGVDSGTQIDESDKLFNFDVEVKPLLNVLVSKTLAQALAEVKEELEMASIVRERKLLTESKAEAARVDKKLEDDAKAAFRQKELKKREQALKQQRIRVMREKVLAWQLAHSTIGPDTVAQATRTLEHKGVFYNPLHRDLAQWLAQEVYVGADAKLQLRLVASSLLDDLLAMALRRESIIAQLLPHDEEAFVRITLRDPIVANVAAEDPGDDATLATKEISVLGPVALSRKDSIELIESKLQAWVVEHVGPDVTIPVGGLLSLLTVAESI